MVVSNHRIVVPRYDDNKTYPILVRLGGYNLIVEMLGKVANDWNDKIYEKQQEANKARRTY